LKSYKSNFSQHIKKVWTVDIKETLRQYPCIVVFSLFLLIMLIIVFYTK